ncbi:MAG: transcription antitermination protein NusB [Duncaniella sp.]|nr:transcription antitermination protein NusB [Duncaniella sp.]
MVNRVLIRIKVVQLLYSYLLSRSEFRIEQLPENPSRDKKYGHALYLDFLLLMLELAGYDVTDGKRASVLRGLTINKYIHRGRLTGALSTLPEVREVILKERGTVERFDEAVPEIYAAIAELPAYKNFAKIKQPELKDEVDLWLSIADNIFAKHPALIAAARKSGEFSVAGYTRGVNSLTSTIKDYGNNRSLYNQMRHALVHSLDKAYELYHRLLLLAPAITEAEALRLDEAKHKLLPTDADLHPDLRFVDNRFVAALKENAELEQFKESHKAGWAANDMLIVSLLNKILASDVYRDYMNRRGETTFGEDAEFWREVYKTIILPGDDLADALENESVYWNDDLHVMGTFLLKTLRHFAISKNEGADVRLLPQFKDDEDRRFGPELFELSIKNFDEYRALIDRFLKKDRWDSDRLAFMDVVILVVAIAEIINYANIPVAVSCNEYIEIANAYSSPRSGAFINGILYSVVEYLKAEGKIFKN